MAIHGYKGGVISATAPTVSPSSASGVWTLDEQLQNSAEWPITNTLLSNSTRFRSSATAYMSRTPTTAGNRRTWTFSAWVKRVVPSGSDSNIFFGGDSTNGFGLYLNSSGIISVGAKVSGISNYIDGTAVYRDPSAWYHIVCTLDTTQATASNRVKVYVNGVQDTTISNSTQISQNQELAWNNNVVQYLGRNTWFGSYSDMYLAEVNFIDGQALTPNYFGATNPNTGVWQPAQFHGTYGTNGFYLPMNIEQLQASFTRSLRFRASASAYLSRTFSTTGTNNKIQTFSFWTKVGSMASGQFALLSCYDGSSANNAAFQFFNNVLRLDFGGVNAYQLISTQVFRDPSAWYHIVFAIDTTQATASNRIKMYVNGSQITSFTTADYPPQNSSSQFMSANGNNKIGTWWNNGYSFYDGYMAELHFIDGLALEPNLFGTVDATSGAWVPVTYAGSYGTNGFYLPFTNNTSTTTLGYDFSGLGNNWTTNNFSLTAGSTYDSMTDVPTLTSETASNFCTLNPVAKTYANGTKSAGNLDFVGDGTNYCQALGTIATPLSGKYYWEVTATVGVGSAERRLVGLWSTNNFNFSLDTPQESTQGALHYYALDGDIAINDPFPFADYGASWTTGDVIGVAVNIDTNQVTFYKNNVSQGAVSLPSNMQGVPLYPSGISLYSNSGLSFNFGQRPFAYTPPTGFVALNTYNM